MAEPVTPVNGEKLQTAGFWHLFAGIIMVIISAFTFGLIRWPVCSDWRSISALPSSL